VVWIPGVTIDERYRATPGSPGWIAEIEDLHSTERGAAGSLEPETLRIAR
jgi:hypothetical protein